MRVNTDPVTLPPLINPLPTARSTRPASTRCQQTPPYSSFFFLNTPPPTEISPLPLHDALPICHFRLRRIGMDVKKNPLAVTRPGPPELATIVENPAVMRFVPPFNGNSVDDFAVVRRIGFD